MFWESPSPQDNDRQLEIRKEMAYKLADVEHISILETISEACRSHFSLRQRIQRLASHRLELICDISVDSNFSPPHL